MEENRSSATLIAVSKALKTAYHKSLKLCLGHLKCEACQLYNEKIVNSYDTPCLAVLLADYAAKLSQAAKAIEEKENKLC